MNHVRAEIPTRPELEKCTAPQKLFLLSPPTGDIGSTGPEGKIHARRLQCPQETKLRPKHSSKAHPNKKMKPSQTPDYLCGPETDLLIRVSHVVNAGIKSTKKSLLPIYLKDEDAPLDT